MIDETRVQPSAAGQHIENVLKKLTDSAHVNAVFSQPVERGNATIVGCSEVAVGLGFGTGGGAGNPQAENQHQANAGYGEGGGAGGGVRSRPVAVVVITQSGVTVQPVFDLTKVVLATLTTVGFLTAWLARLNNSTRGKKSTKAPSLGAFKRAISD